MHTSSVYTDAELQQNLTEMQHLYDRGEFGAWRQEVAARLDDLIDPTKIEQERTLTLRETYQDENGVSIKTTGSGIAVEGDSGEIRLDNVTRCRSRKGVGNSGKGNSGRDAQKYPK